MKNINLNTKEKTPLLTLCKSFVNMVKLTEKECKECGKIFLCFSPNNKRCPSCQNTYLSKTERKKRSVNNSEAKE